MALMKAKTANEKAKSVDHLELVLGEIDQQIRYAVSEGSYRTSACVEHAEVEAVRAALQKAGYSVSIAEAPVGLVGSTCAPSWWERLLPSFGKQCEYKEQYVERYTRLIISWELVRETQKA